MELSLATIYSFISVFYKYVHMYIHSYIAPVPSHNMKYKCNSLQVYLDDDHLFKKIGVDGFDSPEIYRIRHTSVPTGYVKKSMRKQQKNKIDDRLSEYLCIDDFFSDLDNPRNDNNNNDDGQSQSTDIEIMNDDLSMTQKATVLDKQSNNVDNNNNKGISKLKEKIISRRRSNPNKKMQLDNQQKSPLEEWEDMEFELKVEKQLV